MNRFSWDEYRATHNERETVEVEFIENHERNQAPNNGHYNRDFDWIHLPQLERNIKLKVIHEAKISNI